MLWPIKIKTPNKEAAAESMIYSYRHGFSGFAAKMTESHAQYIAGLPGVIEVLPNILYKLQTTRSMEYLGLSRADSNSLLNVANQGDGVIIGVIDSGVWPESDSFSDTGLNPIPTRWRGRCDAGAQFNPSQHCNRKLIGARYFIDGFLAAYPGTPDLSKEYRSPRDSSGHGTHCASIAAGAMVDNINLHGLARGTARGAAPRARLAIYKVLWDDYITSADVLAAFDTAIYDGVDVLSVSLGITVVCSGGNSGPLYGTIENIAPWVINVAASTMDRSFPTNIYLGNLQSFTGQSMYVGEDTGSVDLYYQETAEIEELRYCETIREDEPWIEGRIVLCFTEKGDEGDILEASINVQSAGGLGLIATKKNFGSISTFHNRFPCVLVTFEVGTQILNYIRSTSGPKVRLLTTRTYTGIQASTQIASFSSRGPNTLSQSVLKPDIAAPGVDILAANIPSALGLRTVYNFQSGTSMATPHVAGIVALLKVVHPNWSPAAIRSAIVTKAWTTDPYSGETIFARGDIPKVADPFDYGGGIINPNSARNPGLIYDIGTQNYINYLCAMGYNTTSINQLTGGSNTCPTTLNSVLDLNLPSITVPNLRNQVTVRRTVTNVGNPSSTYDAVINPPQGEQASTFVASFSSRSPNTLSPSVLKPDTAAPGVDIVAADIPSALGLRIVYNFRSGTSMATPHVAGIVALLKVACPACSPAAIRSAIVTPGVHDFLDGMVDVNASTMPGSLVDEDNAVSKDSIDVRTMSVPHTSTESVNTTTMDLLFPNNMENDIGNNMGTRAETIPIVTPPPTYQESSSQVPCDTSFDPGCVEAESNIPLRKSARVTKLPSHLQDYDVSYSNSACLYLCLPLCAIVHGQQTLTLGRQFSKREIYLRGADPFDYGGGVINPNGAGDPGLIYDIGTQDYINYLCAMGYSETSIDQVLTGEHNTCPTTPILYWI
ncbi:hypothetical protein BUALT_Bualt06G0137300 [Buddleja alternifolia]|uniref:Uncharacterized protein n=1 Tax=Buddleja alternifolia TaxID=168488 RepID=A0AAV6XJA6_9LAMI|nr:hypothetical protein BUALT_Bualt06G0137300 [Buddleja alternifolia]